MSGRLFKLALLLVAIAWLPSCSGDRSAAIAQDEAGSVLIDRNWITHWPKSGGEKLQVFRFTPSMGGGVFQDRTLYAGTFELFKFALEPGVIVFDLPHTGDQARARYRIDRVDGPHPFDLRLTISPSPRGDSVYSGRTAERPGRADEYSLPPLGPVH